MGSGGPVSTADVIAIAAVAVLAAGLYLKWSTAPVVGAYRLGRRLAEWQLTHRKDRSP